MMAGTRSIRVGGVLLMCAVALAGCAQRRYAPLGGSVADAKSSDLLGGMVVPLVVRSVDISAADGQRAVFFKLSRVPDGVLSSDQSNPSRVVIEVDGPPIGEDLPAQEYPGADVLVNRIEMSRTKGRLRLVLELSTEAPPTHYVLQMADYIVVQFDARR